jgi:hypothetical protein
MVNSPPIPEPRMMPERKEGSSSKSIPESLTASVAATSAN